MQRGRPLQGMDSDGFISEALRLLHEVMPEHRIAPTEVSFTTVMGMCAQRGDARTAAELLSEMRSQRLPKRHGVRYPGDVC